LSGCAGRRWSKDALGGGFWRRDVAYFLITLTVSAIVLAALVVYELRRVKDDDPIDTLWGKF
jgi:hypothetical protein